MKRRTNNTNKIRKYFVFGLIVLLLCSSIVSSTEGNIVKKQNIVKKLGGMTGDTIGAVIEISQTIFMFFCYITLSILSN